VFWGGGGVVVVGSTALCGHPNLILYRSWVVTISNMAEFCIETDII
jgi:hypothetical protein